MRDLVRTQLDLDDTDLPDPLLDAFIQEGYDRVLELEQRWPFFETRWTLDVPVGGEVAMPVDTAFVEMLITPAGLILQRIPLRLAVTTFPPGQPASGTPTYWSRLNRSIVVVPPPSATMTLTVIGYRAGFDWINVIGASGECDCDRRLHIPICWYACSLGYAQQEDEVLEATYLARFKENAMQARDAIMRASPITPKQVAYTHYPSSRRGPGGPAQLIINTPGP
jgi:hypothetical protein